MKQIKKWMNISEAVEFLKLRKGYKNKFLLAEYFS